NPEFTDPYISKHMAKLGDLIWRYDSDAPMWLLGDEHWFQLIASWFNVIDRCIVKPAIAEGKTVIVDNWMPKYMSRFSLKPNFDIHAFRNSISNLSTPDKVIFLNIAPSVAAKRKGTVNSSESGLMDGYDDVSISGFIDYQSKVANYYLQEVDKFENLVINVEDKNAPEVLNLALNYIG
ncbi:hypothetical protein O1D38_003851, partial [Vibrio cholerae]|nr:hypothetical protein [Vibrio cholerae]